jgi:hypothetical protein
VGGDGWRTTGRGMKNVHMVSGRKKIARQWRWIN